MVLEQLRQGKKLEDARAGGCSGCVEVGAFGKEAYILTGYFNMVKVLEITLHNGVDPMTGRPIGLPTGAPDAFPSFPALFEAWRNQFRHFLEIKLRGNQIIERMFAQLMPAPFLSVLTDDCIQRGLDYNAGGARYNNSYVQFVGLGSLTDSFSALRQFCLDGQAGGAPVARNGNGPQAGSRLPLSELVAILDADFAEHELLRQRLVNRAHKYGNDDDAADDLAVDIFNACFEELDGRPNAKGGHYRIEMLPTTCHVYFGSVIGAMPDGRRARQPLSEGISPVQGADRRGPTAVLKSAAKLDHLKPAAPCSI